MKTLLTTDDNLPIEEREMRSALIDRINANYSGVGRVIEEFPLERGGSRIDVAVVGGELVGYEIKSDKDSFARFSNQIHAYNRVFGRIYLVCGPALFELAMQVVPSWWGILVASRDGADKISLTIAREARENPKQDAFSLASLLRKDEVIAVLSLTKSPSLPPKSASVHALWDCLARSQPLESIRSSVTSSLLRR